MSTEKLISVTFLHPRDSKRKEFELGISTTGARAIQGLVEAKFLDAESGRRQYALQTESGDQIPHSKKLVDAGVADGATVHVVEGSAGAADVLSVRAE